MNFSPFCTHKWKHCYNALGCIINRTYLELFEGASIVRHTADVWWTIFGASSLVVVWDFQKHLKSESENLTGTHSRHRTCSNLQYLFLLQEFCSLGSLFSLQDFIIEQMSDNQHRSHRRLTNSTSAILSSVLILARWSSVSALT